MAYPIAYLKVLAIAVLVLSVPQWAKSEECRGITMTNEALAAWYNPHPSRSDFLLPLPGGMSLVFVQVPLGTTGLYGDERTTYTMGASQPTIYETPLEVRVGSSITDTRGQSVMLFGKYEVTKAQYAAVMAPGDLRAGLQILQTSTKSTRDQREIQHYLDEQSPCHEIITVRLHRILAEPLTFMSHRDYLGFVDAYNQYCISRIDCRRILSSLGNNRDVPGFIRLPREHEWEFVARGGRNLASGRLSKAAIQNDLPALPTGSLINDFAHAGNDPPTVLPIGSRQPLFGFYDLLGNAQELMGNSFTAENGFGAVGAFVARGGHFGLDFSELRTSKRVELTPFRIDDATGLLDRQYFPRTGIRLAVGLPIAGAAERLGDSSLADDFVENYVAPDEAGDIAGNRLSEARVLGKLGDDALRVTEELDRNDSEDWYLMSLQDYGRIVVVISDGQGLEFEIVDSRLELLGQRTEPAAQILTDNLIPDDYWLRVRSTVGRLPSEVRYSVSASRILVPDSGIERPDPASLRAADIISETYSRQIEGFVGQGDSVDTFPVFSPSTTEGLEVELKTDSQLIVSLLDDRLQLLQRETVVPERGTARVRLAMPAAFLGFVQVEADLPAQSVYAMRMRVKAPFDREFLTEFPQDISSISTFARSNKTYEGTLSGRQRVYLPFILQDRRSIKLELSDLDADVTMSVIRETRRIISSNHGRAGRQPEFFAKTLDRGTYFVSLRLDSETERSSFKLTYRSDEPEAFVRTAEELRLQARAEATNLGLVGPDGVYSFELARGAYQYFSFTIVGYREELTELLSTEGSNGEDFDLILENASGEVLAKSAKIGSERERIVHSILPGRYYALLTRTRAASDAGIGLSVITIGELREPELSWLGPTVEVHGDFTVRRTIDRSGRTLCSMTTVARNITPSINWRKHKPYFYAAVTQFGTGAFLWMDEADELNGVDLYQSGSLLGSVIGFGFVPLVWRDEVLQPIAKCTTFGTDMCISNSAVRKFIDGRQLVIEGLTPDGERARFSYSLIGYTAAARSITAMCNSSANFLWRK